MSGSSHGLGRSELSDQVVHLSHLSRRETEGDGDSKWKSFWNGDDNDGDGNDHGVQKVDPESVIKAEFERKLDASSLFLTSEKVSASAWSDSRHLEDDSEDHSEEGKDSTCNTNVTNLVSDGGKSLLQKGWLGWLLCFQSDDTGVSGWSNSDYHSLTESSGNK